MASGLALKGNVDQKKQSWDPEWHSHAGPVYTPWKNQEMDGRVRREEVDTGSADL